MSKPDTDWEGTRQNARWERICNGKRCMVENLGADNDWRAWVQVSPTDDRFTHVGFYETERGAKRAATMAARAGAVKPGPSADYVQDNAESQLARLRAGLMALGMRKHTRLVDRGSYVEEVPVETDHWVKGDRRTYVKVTVDHPSTLANAYRKTYNIRGIAVVGDRRKDKFSSSASVDKLHIGVSQALGFARKWGEKVP